MWGYKCADPEGRQGVWTPRKNHKAIGLLSNTGPDPLKNHKATTQTCRFTGGPKMTLF